MSIPALRTILLAEDDPNVRELSAMVLEMFGGFTVAACRHGGEAVESARRLLPDLIVLDWMMPRVDGPDAMAALKSDPRTSQIPVVLMTARSCPDELARMTELGAAGIVSKPFDPAALPRQLHRLWSDAVNARASAPHARRAASRDRG